MHPQMAILILHSSAFNLTHLTLDNLQSPVHRGGRYSFTYGSAEDWPAFIESSAMTLPGTIRGVLSSLQGRCDSLESFRYRRPGCIQASLDYFSGADESAFSELAAFLDSVRSSLQAFSFEQGVTRRYMTKMHRLPKLHQASPMEDRFRKHVSYVSNVSMYNGWAKLRRQKFVGVWQAHDFTSLDLQWRFRESVEATVDLMPTRPCDTYEGNSRCST